MIIKVILGGKIHVSSTNIIIKITLILYKSQKRATFVIIGIEIN